MIQFPGRFENVTELVFNCKKIIVFWKKRKEECPVDVPTTTISIFLAFYPVFHHELLSKRHYEKNWNRICHISMNTRNHMIGRKDQ